MRIFRELSLRLDARVTFGSHMATGMSLGLLFLGGGAATLGTDNYCMAALLTSLYPIFPSGATDQLYHLTPLRHFWVLAASARSAIVVDAATKTPVRGAMVQCFGPSQELLSRAQSPCLLPDLKHVSSIVVESPNHVPVKLATNSAVLECPLKIYQEALVVPRSLQVSFEDWLASEPDGPNKGWNAALLRAVRANVAVLDALPLQVLGQIKDFFANSNNAADATQLAYASACAGLPPSWALRELLQKANASPLALALSVQGRLSFGVCEILTKADNGARF